MTQQEDTLPWYRQFWPWFLISIPGATVIAGLYTIMLAMDTSDSLVTSAAGGMDVVTERHIAAEQRADSLGLDAKLSIDATTGAITAELASTAGGDWPQTLELLFSHPTNAQLDKTITLTTAIPAADGTPRWAGHVATSPPGRMTALCLSPSPIGWCCRYTGPSR